MASERKICSDFTAPRSGDAAAIDLDAERIVMLTGWRAVRHAAKDWRTFSSHAPFRVPIPSIVSLAGDDRGVNVAVEELLRISSPLAHIGRVCPHGSAVDGLAVEVEPGARVSLCWTGANAAPSVFAKPERLILDRAPNPHVAFGGGTHTCLGAPQARAILRGPSARDPSRPSQAPGLAHPSDRLVARRARRRDPRRLHRAARLHRTHRPLRLTGEGGLA